MKNKPYLIKSQVGGVKCKFLFAFFAALLILIGNSQAYADEEPKSTTDGVLIYTLRANGESASVKAASKDISDEIEILDEVTIGDKEYPVTEIEEDGFENCEQITKVTIPGSVTKIGEYAFDHCTSLVSVSFPESVVELGEGAFWSCESLSEINIPKSLTKIGNGVFAFCEKLATISIAEGHTKYSLIDGFLLESLENKAKNTIAYIGKQATVVIPDGVETIGNYTFESCNALAIFIPNSVTTIGRHAFDACSKMQSINIPNSVTTIGNYAFSSCTFTSITIPRSVTKLNYTAFWYCNNLQKVYIENLEEDFTWEGDEGDLPKSTNAIVYLEESLSYDVLTVTLPDGITATGEDITTFGDRVYVKSGATLTLSQPEEYGYSFIVPKYGCSFDETNLALSNITADINIALNVPDITYVLNDDKVEVKVLNKGIAGDIVIPEQVTINGSKYSVTVIPSDCFENCTGITSIKIPNSVTVIGNYAFYDCEALTTVTIDNYPGGVRWDENVPNKTSIVYLKETPNYEYRVLSEEEQTAYLKFVNSEYNGTFNVPASVSINDKDYKVVAIGDNAFYDCDGIKIVNISEGVKSIGEHAFDDCDNIVEISIPESVEYIGKYAFYYCDFQSINIPNGVKAIEESTFRNCGSLLSITIPESVKSIGEEVFYHCYNLKTIYVENKNEDVDWKEDNIPQGATVYYLDDIPEGAFSVTFPTDITVSSEEGGILLAQGNRVWVNSNATLTLSQPDDGYSFIVPTDVCSFDKNKLTLSNITANINITLQAPDIIYYLGGKDVVIEVLNNDISGDIVIPEQVTIKGSKYSVTVIPPECFENCTGITSISIPNSVYYIGENAFDGCTNLKTITIDNCKGGIRYLNCKFPDNVEVIYLHEPELFKFTQIGNTNTVMVEFGGKQQIGAIVIPADDGKGHPVVAIAAWGFKELPGITSVTIPEGVTYIGKGAFYNCIRLTSVNIPSTVTDIDAPFVGCSSLKNVNIADKSPLTFNNGFLINNIKDENGTVTEKVLVGYYGNDVNVAVPDGVTTIAEDAFVYNNAMESLFIPSSVKSLASGFLYVMNGNLKGIYVDNSEEVLPEETVGVLESYKNPSIDVYYLKDIEGIKNAVCYVSIPSGFTAQGEDGITVVGNRVYLDKNITSFKLAYTSSEPLPDGSKLIADDNNITITEQENGYLVSNITGNAEIILELPIFSFQSIGPNMAAVNAYKPQSLSGVIEIPSTCTINNENYDVKAIGERAFIMSGITSVTIPEGFEAILQAAFGMCYALSSVTLPESLTFISDNAFRMSGISSITIPKKVTTVGANAFTDCSNLKTIYVQQDPNPLLANAGVPEGCKVIFLGEDERIMYNINQNYIFNGEYEGSLAMSTFPGDRKNQNVSLKRTFIPGVYSTIILPFEINNADECGEFYTFKGVNYDKTLGQWVADVELVTKPQANTPYLFKASTPLPEFTNGLTTIKATPSSLSITNGNWTLTGTYQYKQWKDGASNVYGFAGEPSTDAEGNDIEIGEFVQAGAGASINPFRCYLEHKGDGLSKRNTNLPKSIIVRVVQPDETESIEQPETTEPTEIITPVAEISEQISAKAWSYNGTIYIESQPGTDYQIIDLSGRVIKTGVTHSTREEITLNRNAGIVIVNINGKSFKVNL